ncbi:MAG: hypothetical protein E3J64_01685 [Anaerolineales bacterium]|nr:MAG: hypothetical protein E3J64_01685 [Anaerolineales bacterium]
MFLVSGFLQTVILLSLFLPIILVWLFALADLFIRRDLRAGARVVWLLVIVLVPLLGPLVYLVLRVTTPSEEWRG